MVALITVLVVVLISLLVARVGTLALIQTGLSKETARFQARSALSAAGFTTTESEKVVNHPVRRRIILNLMLLGSAGLVAAVGSLVISFGHANTDQQLQRGLILVGGLFVIWRLSHSSWVDRQLSRAIGWILRLRGFHECDRASLLELSGDYEVSELGIGAGGPLASRRLGDVASQLEGVVVLGVRRSDGDYVGAPDEATRFDPGDNVVIYGPRARIAELDARGR